MQFKPITAIIILLLVVASLLVAGCTSSQQTTTQSTGTTSTNQNIAVTVKAVQSPSQISSETPRPGYKWAVYNTTVKNVNAPNKAITRNYFSAQDTQGRNYNVSGGLSEQIAPYNFSTHSQPGDVLGGIVVFEVPQNATLKSLTYFDGTTKIVTTL